jgi:hypothetical protein
MPTAFPHSQNLPRDFETRTAGLSAIQNAFSGIPGGLFARPCSDGRSVLGSGTARMILREPPYHALSRLFVTDAIRRRRLDPLRQTLLCEGTARLARRGNSNIPPLSVKRPKNKHDVIAGGGGHQTVAAMFVLQAPSIVEKELTACNLLT